MSSAKQDAMRDRIEVELGDPLRVLGLDIEAVDITPAGKRRILRIAVDKDGGVTLDEVAEATREVNRVLDDSDVMGEQPYTLEVTSRGVDRPLTLPRHFARNVGRLVTVTLDDESKVAGRITRADAQTVQVTPEQGGKKAGAAVDAEPARLNYTSITGAKVQVEFTRGDDADAVGEDV